MAPLSPAKALLLAVQATSKSDIPTLRTLVSQYRKHLNNETVLRILLSHLPESLEAVNYVQFLVDLASDNVREDGPVDTSSLDDLNDDEAKHKARKLHLLPLAWPHHPPDIPTDPLVLFLIHRSLRIDENTGLIIHIPELLEPFLQHSSYLRSWLVTSILPLERLYYMYHPTDGDVLTISEFERLDDHSGLGLLLSRTGRDNSSIQDQSVGRDLRGLVGPWLYGDTRYKRRKVLSLHHRQSAPPLEEGPVHREKYVGWEEVFKWLTAQAATSWQTAVKAVQHWDGPGDVDTGGYGVGLTWLDEDDEQHLELRYARSILAAAYLVPEETIEALEGVQKMLARLVTLMDKDKLPTLEQAGAMLQPVTILEGELMSRKSATFLRHCLLDEENVLTRPQLASIILLQALLISAFLCTRAQLPLSVRKSGELALLQNEHDQKLEFAKLILHVSAGPKGDDKYWSRSRNEILWLRSWGAEELEEGANPTSGRGIFGKLPRAFVEQELLKALLDNTRYTLARSIYETSSNRPLPRNKLEETILAAAMNAYDNATNPNKTRGGVKKSLEILHSFPETLRDSISAQQMEHLITVTHALGNYKLAYKQGEPFRPVSLRVHPDPISIIGKVLDQNPRSYAQIGDFVNMARTMVEAGLTSRECLENVEVGKASNHEEMSKNLSTAEKRVVSMCIDAALAEDDFETAYSYVVTRLKDISGPARARSPELERKHHGLFPQAQPKIIDDWSWRAALQAGKYRRSSQTVKPTHLGNASANLEIRHLEQRMECLSQALRLAPKTTLQEILNVYRRCEEELESQYKQEAEQEDAWDTQGDNTMPGSFAPTPSKSHKATRGTEEAPMSLFDLSRASMARAQSGFSSLALARNVQQKPRPHSRVSGETDRPGTPESGAPGHVRKRDQLRNAAVGGLASGVGWILGAPPVKNNHDDNRNE